MKTTANAATPVTAEELVVIKNLPYANANVDYKMSRDEYVAALARARTTLCENMDGGMVQALHTENVRSLRVAALRRGWQL